MRHCAFVLFIVLCAILHSGGDLAAQRNAESRYGSELGIPEMEVFSTKELEYADVTNWDCVRDRRGILWVANTYGLLEYDGSAWNFIASENTWPFFSVSCGNDNTIYFGTLGGFGRLVADSLGTSSIEFLSDTTYLPSNAPHFGMVTQILSHDDDIWFITAKALFQWDGKTCSYILPRTGFKRAFTAHGRMYVYQDSIGICRLQGGEVSPVPGGEFFADPTDRLLFLYGTSSGDVILGNRRHGIFRYDGEQFTQMLDYVRDLEPDCLPYCGIELTDGTIALGTARSGIWIVDTTGALITVIDKNVGLPDNAVKHLYQDDENNIWAILDAGLVRIKWPARTTVFDSELGADGKISTILRYRGNLYIGSTQGLSRLRKASIDGTKEKYSPARFSVIPDIQTTVHDLLEVEGQLLIASEQGVYLKNGTAPPRIIAHRGARKLLRLSGSRDTVMVGSGDGCFLLINEGNRWRARNFINDMRDMVLNLCEDAWGSIWVGTARAGIYRITRKNGILRPEVSNFLPPGREEAAVDVYLLKGRPLFMLDGDGVHWFDEDTRTFVYAKEVTELAPIRSTDSEPRVISQVRDGQYWTQLFTGVAGYLSKMKNGRYVLEGRDGFLSLLGSGVYDTHVDDDGVFWLSAEGMVFRLDQSIAQPIQTNFTTFIRGISVDGNTVYDGYASLDPASVFRFADDHRRVTIRYAVPGFGNRERVLYQHRLDGIDTTWSSPNEHRVSVEYLQLPHGDYRFRVRAVTLDGIMGEERAVAFSVLLPWHRSWWAILLYVLALGGVAFVGRMWYRSRYLVERSRELELLVNARTEEIQSQAKEISRQAEELERLDNIVRTVNRETQLPYVLDALLMQSLLLFPHADIALFVRRDVKGERFRVIAAVGRNAADLKERTFTLRELVGSADASLERMREGVYFLRGLGRMYIPENHDGRETHFMAMVIERARLLEGFLVLGSTTEDTFGESDLRRLMRLKEHASSAIAKAGAIEELEDKNTQLDNTNRRLVETQRQLVAHEKLAALGELTAGIAHEIQNPLNFVNNFSELSCELLGELEQSLRTQSGNGDPQTDRLIEQIRSNCNHIREHGRRATSIVSAMIMHSRTGMSQRSSVVLNDLVDEFVMLAYHGMRLQFPQFTLDLHRHYDRDIDEVEILPQDLSRVIVNICNNAWEAALNHAADEGGDFVPTVNVETRDLGSSVQISITDNGHGIPKDLREKIFEPFFTTRRSSRNAGLGLSLSYDIVTQLHGGELTVHSTPGARTEFRIVIPREAPE